jgi:chromosome segregation ATPase
LALLAAPVIAAIVVAVAWQGSSVGASRPPAVRVQDRTQTKIETQVVTATQTQTNVVKDTSGFDQLSAQIAALQQTVTATAQGTAGQIATLKQTITSLQGTITTLQQGLATAQANTAAQTKKVTDLSNALTDVTNRLFALQTLVQSKLYPSPSPTH